MKEQINEREDLFRVMDEIAAGIQAALDAQTGRNRNLPEAMARHSELLHMGFKSKVIRVTTLHEALKAKGKQFTREQVSAALDAAGVRPVAKRSKAKPTKRSVPETAKPGIEGNPGDTQTAATP
jgi:hypothetical protein